MPHEEKYGPHYPNRYEVGRGHADALRKRRSTSPTKYTTPFKYSASQTKRKRRGKRAPKKRRK